MVILRRALVTSSLAAVVSAALVLGVVSPSYGSTAAPAPRTESVADLPPLVSEAPKQQHGTALTSTDGVRPVSVTGGDASPAPAFPSASALASASSDSFNPITSGVVSRSAFATIYRNADGTMSEESSPSPLNFEKPSGAWAPISTSVSQMAGGGYTDASHPLDPVFAASADDSYQDAVTSNGNIATFDLVGARSVAASAPSALDLGANGGVASSAVAYDDVLPGQNLVFQVTDSGVNTSIVLPSQLSSSAPSWTWDIHAPGLTLAKDSQDDIVFTDSQGAEQFITPVASMRDSSGVPGQSESSIVNIPETLSQLADGDWSLTLTPDPTWLSSPDRVYPVYVDPSPLDAAASNQNAYENVGSHLTGVTYVGNSRAGSADTYWRTVETYLYASAHGKEITDAALELDYAGAGTYTAEPGAVYDPTAYSYPGAASSTTKEATYTISYGPSGYGIADSTALRKLVQVWTDTGTSGDTLGIVGNEAAGSYTYKSVTPTLIISYEDKPTVTLRQETIDGITTSPNGGSTVVGPVAPTLEVNSTDPSGDGLKYVYSVSTSSTPSTDASPAWRSPATASDVIDVPQSVLAENTSYNWQVTATDAYGVTVSSPVYSWKTSVRPVKDAGVSDSPADQSPVATLTPTLVAPAATVGNGMSLSYSFRIATGADGDSGELVQSPPINPSSGVVSWTVPAGIIDDGSTYTWEEVVNDSYDNWFEHVNRMRVNMRITDSGPSPTDSAGPVTVNLANGNLSASFSSPTVSTLGGSMGLQFNYNSQTPSNAGLVGKYYTSTSAPANNHDPNGDFSASGVTQVMQRTDPYLAFDWGTDGTATPGANVPQTLYMAQWTGELTPPDPGPGATKTYAFGFIHDDGAALYLNNELKVNQWIPSHQPTPQFDTSASDELTVNAGGTTGMLGTEPVQFPFAITVDYFQKFGGALFDFEVEDVSTPSSAQIVPGSWLTKSTSLLPGGWSSSGVVAGDSDEYVKAQDHGGYVTLTDVNGGTHTYKKGANGTAYTAPPGESGVLQAESQGGALSFTDDAGTHYEFDKFGNVTSVTTPEDTSHPAEPVPTYSSGGFLEYLSDPLSYSGGSYGRQITFHYSAALPGGPSACPTSLPSGAATAPPGMLCQMTYPDGSATDLYYNVAGQLIEIVNPGSAVTNFGYATVTVNHVPVSLLSDIRNVTANDWLMADVSRDPNGPVSTTIDYTSDGAGDVSSVQLPAPDGVTSSSRPTKTYSYDSLPYVDSSGTEHDGVTYVDQSGLTVPGGGGSDGHARKVEFNTALQTDNDISAGGQDSQENWDNNDQLLWSIDPSNTQSATQYDSQGRPLVSYGPAPSSCFSGNTLLSACTNSTATTSTTYDQGLTDGSGNTGLDVSYYNNQYYQGIPVAHGLGIESDGNINKTWASGVAPASGVNTSDWSIAMNGMITFPSAGTYWFFVTADDSAELYINGSEIASVVKANTTASGSVVVDSSDLTVPIRLDMAQLGGPAQLTLKFAMSQTGPQSLVGTTMLSPNYGLSTSSTTLDNSTVSGATVPSSVNTTTNYGSSPWLGQVASTSVDTAGLNLTGTATYETGSGLYNRQLTSTKPAGSATATTNAYYSATDTIATGLSLTGSVCGENVSTPQYGMVKSTTSPTPASGSALVTQYVYDVLGRVVGEKTNAQSAWTCTSYDSRGRVISIAFPDRTVTYNFAVGGDPLTSSVSDPTGTITTTSDLLGRTVTSTDVGGTVTTNYYNDPLGQLDHTTVQPPSGSGVSTQTLKYKYDVDGSVSEEDLNGDPIAEVSYDSAERLSGITYPSASGGAGNGTSLSSITYGNTGAVSGQTWSFASGSPLSDANVLSQAGQVLQDTITDGSTPYVSTYSYDGVGRLVSATVPDNSLSYSFASSGGCGADAAAGKDGNRTGFSDTTTGGTGASATPVAVSYCYDNADRLTSDSVSGAPSGESPLLAGNLMSATGPGQNLTYDAAGNITALADESMTYDQENRHVSTTTSAPPATTVTYTRDASGDAVKMETNISGGTDTVVTYTGGGGIDFTLNSAGHAQEETLTLPGGVTVSMQGATLGSTQVWSYPDMHGDDTVTADASGARSSGVNLYDPFGDPIDLATGLIGTLAANADTPDNTTVQGTSYGWEGSQSKQDLTSGDIATVEMGDRQYLPLLGRFLSVDPVAGGNANDYNYPNDPINGSDLTGDDAVLAIMSWIGVVELADVPLDWNPVGWAIAGLGAAALTAFGSYELSVSLSKWLAGVMTQAEHTSNARESNRGKHEKGAKRKKQKDTDKKRNKPGWTQNPNHGGNKAV